MADYNRGRGEEHEGRREREDYGRQYGDQRGYGQRDRDEYERDEGSRSPQYGVEPPNYGRGRSYEGHGRTEQYDYPGGSYAQGAEYGRPEYGQDYARREMEGHYGERRPSGHGDYARQEFAGEQRYNERIYGGGRSHGPDDRGRQDYERAQGYGSGQNYGGPSDEQQYAAMEGYRGQGTTPYGGGYGPSMPTGRSGYGEEQPGGYGQAGPASAQRRGGFRGRGPRNYRRSDERITEEINDRLTDHDGLDAEDIEVSVTSGEVIITGTVDSRGSKRLAEDIAESVAGVTQVQNQLRVLRPDDRERQREQDRQGSRPERERSGRSA